MGQDSEISIQPLNCLRRVEELFSWPDQIFSLAEEHRRLQGHLVDRPDHRDLAAAPAGLCVCPRARA